MSHHAIGIGRLRTDRDQPWKIPMEARLYVVSYDIASPRRWRHMQKLLRRLCKRSQLSVFVCRGTAARVGRLEGDMRRIMDPATDRLMIVDLGPAATAAGKLRSLNAITDISDLESVVL